MIPKPRIGAIVFNVADLARSEAFYRDRIGLPLVRQAGDAHTNGDFLLAVLDGGVEVLFFQGETSPGNSPVVVFDLAEGGIDTVVEALARAGVPIVTPVSEAPGGWTADFADPDGHVLSMYQAGTLPRAA
ncbi:VOC family protein [Coralloluteibacterium thermophilus]|uniref:VOC family protein n=1 Tax=Coralloluteibacterium thermophilum TaxID=2707049 RepID=A0ABV9NI51_9GAMM